jgi:2-keto-4-pentenoate hydratase
MSLRYLHSLAATARLLAAVGLQLQAGDRILCGSSTHVAADPGNHVTAGITALGSVMVKLVD